MPFRAAVHEQGPFFRGHLCHPEAAIFVCANKRADLLAIYDHDEAHRITYANQTANHASARGRSSQKTMGRSAKAMGLDALKAHLASYHG